ncbi:unnamed protein product [Arctogadus glacialis]
METTSSAVIWPSAAPGGAGNPSLKDAQDTGRPPLAACLPACLPACQEMDGRGSETQSRAWSLSLSNQPLMWLHLSPGDVVLPVDGVASNSIPQTGGGKLETSGATAVESAGKRSR